MTTELNEIAVTPTVNALEVEMLNVRRAFENAFKAVVICVMILVVTTGLAIVAIAFTRTENLSDKLVIAKFIQVTFGMTIGSGCIFLGVILVWLGITSSTTIAATGAANGQEANINMASSSPGVLIAVCGIILVSLSLYRPVGFTDVISSAGSRIEPAPEEITDK